MSICLVKYQSAGQKIKNLPLIQRNTVLPDYMLFEDPYSYKRIKVHSKALVTILNYRLMNALFKKYNEKIIQLLLRNERNNQMP